MHTYSNKGNGREEAEVVSYVRVVLIVSESEEKHQKYAASHGSIGLARFSAHNWKFITWVETPSGNGRCIP